MGDPPGKELVRKKALAIESQVDQSLSEPTPGFPGAFFIDGCVKCPISALRVSLVIAAYDKYASLLGIRKP
jgi:hypothetical protein